MKKGFTLIELLAVIVIMGIIMTFAIMKVSEFIEKAEKQTLIKEADSILDVIRYQISSGEELLSEYNINNGKFVESNKFSYSGKLPESGKIKIIDNEDLLIAISDGYWCVSKSYLDKNYKVYKDEGICTPSLDITADSEMAKCFSFINNSDPNPYGEVAGLTIGKYTCSNRNIIIPTTYNNEPIIGIKDINCVDCISKVDMSYATNLKYIGWSAFRNTGVEEVILSPSIDTILDYSFENNNISKLVIPSSVKAVRAYAFRNNKIVEVTFPNSLIGIGGEAFSNNLIQSLTIPSSVLDIGYKAFANNKLVNIVIQNLGVNISWGAFNNNLFPESMAFIADTTNNNRLVSYGGEKRDNVIIPSSYTIIGSSAFEGNNLTSVTIPSSITSIESFAFEGNNMSNVEIPSSVTSIWWSAFHKTDTSLSSLSSIIYKGTTPHDWSRIINNSSGTPFVTGVVTNTYGDVTISAN